MLGEFLRPGRSTLPPQFDRRVALAVRGDGLPAYPAHVTPDLFGCLTRVPDFLRRGCGSLLGAVQLVGQFLQRLESVVVLRRSQARAVYRPSMRGGVHKGTLPTARALGGFLLRVFQN
jgi:hypothetical protein